MVIKTVLHSNGYRARALTKGARQLVVQDALEITVVASFQHIVIDSVYHGRVNVLAAGSGDDDLFGTGALSGRMLFLYLAKKPVDSRYDIDAQFLPTAAWQGHVRNRHEYLITVDNNVVTVDS